MRQLLILITSVLAGCRTAEPPRVASAADTVVTTTAAVTDTVSGSAYVPPEPEPNDCRYVGTRPRPRMDDPGFGEPYDTVAMANGVPFRCRLRPEGPEVKLVLGGRWGIPMGFHVHLPADAPAPVQSLAVDNDERAREGSDLLVGQDLNGDGWMDLNVYTFSGTGGQMSEVYRFDPSAQRFVHDTVLSPGGNLRRLPGRPCVMSGGRQGLGIWYYREICWSGGAWATVRTHDQDRLPDDRYLRVEQALRDGRMQVVRTDTLTDPNEGLY